MTNQTCVECASTVLRSGRFGGSVANPLHMLSEILASLNDSDGTGAVPGFYDGIPPLAAERREQIGAVAFSGLTRNWRPPERLGIPRSRWALLIRRLLAASLLDDRPHGQALGGRLVQALG
jgi:hypothetical protein